MKLFRKLDNYLLHHYPSIWITRIHSFLPIGLAIFGLLFGLTLLSSWNPHDDLPQDEITYFIMTIPVLTYLVWWFIFQSRYNVLKSGGKMSLAFEYVNFVSYLLVFLVAFLIISAIPLANCVNVRMAVGDEQLNEDVKKLNLGNTLVNNSAEITFNPNSVMFYPTDFSYYYSTDYYYDGYDEPTGMVTVSRGQAIQIIADYIEVYNKYAEYYITEDPKTILHNREFASYDVYDLGPGVFDYSYEVQDKIYNLLWKQDYGWFGIYGDKNFWKVVFAVIAFMASLVWIFKQMKLREFIFGFVALCLTPLFIAIIGVVIFEVLGYYHEEEKIFSTIILIIYGICAFFSIRAYRSNKLQVSGYIMTMYLNFFLPALPPFLFFFFYGNEWYFMFYSEISLFNFFYWSGWILGLANILFFKPVYAKLRSLPSAT